MRTKVKGVEADAWFALMKDTCHHHYEHTSALHPPRRGRAQRVGTPKAEPLPAKVESHPQAFHLGTPNFKQLQDLL